MASTPKSKPSTGTGKKTTPASTPAQAARQGTQQNYGDSVRATSAAARIPLPVPTRAPTRPTLADMKAPEIAQSEFSLRMRPLCEDNLPRPHMGNVEEHLSRLECLVGDLYDQVRVLASRISPILATPDLIGSKGDNMPDQNVPSTLSRRLDNINDAVKEIIAFTGDLNERVAY